MKKFAFLLALIAVFAMMACAWAAPGDITTIGAFDDFSKDVNTNAGADNSGIWEESVFYYGSVDKVRVGTKLALDTGKGPDANAFGARPDGTGDIVYSMALLPDTGNAINVVFDLATPTGATTYAIDTYIIASNTKVSATSKYLKVTPVELIVTATKDAEDVKDKPFTVKTSDSTFDIVIDGKAGTADTLDLAKVDVKSGDTPVSTSTGDLAQWSSSTGKIAIDPTRAKAGDTLTITVKAPETDSAKVLKTATGTQVAGVTANTVFATISIKFVDYIVEPASADWDGSTAAEGVKFTVKDLTADKISKIEIKASGVGPDVLDPANYTATPNGSDVEIELKLEYLKGLSKNDYTFTITGESNKRADFVLSVTPKGSSKDDNGGEENAATTEEAESAATELVKIVPGIAVRPSVATDTVIKTELPSVESTGEFYRVTVESALLARSGDAIAIGAKKIGARLPSESTANGISFVKVFDAANGRGVVPLDEVCGYNSSTGLYELNATVVIIDDKAPATKPAGFVPGAKDGEGVAIVKTDAGSFVYIWDGEKDGIAKDPIFARETNSSSSGGACAAGAGAFAAIAVLAMIKRRKK